MREGEEYCNDVSITNPTSEQRAHTSEPDPVTPSTLGNACLKEGPEEQNGCESQSLSRFKKPRREIAHIVQS